MRLDDNTKRDTLKKAKKKNYKRKKKTTQINVVRYRLFAVLFVRLSSRTNPAISFTPLAKMERPNETMSFVTSLAYFSAGLRHDVVLSKHLCGNKFFSFDDRVASRLCDESKWEQRTKNETTEANAKSVNWEEKCREWQTQRRCKFCHLEFHCRDCSVLAGSAGQSLRWFYSILWTQL